MAWRIPEILRTDLTKEYGFYEVIVTVLEKFVDDAEADLRVTDYRIYCHLNTFLAPDRDV